MEKLKKKKEKRKKEREGREGGREGKAGGLKVGQREESMFILESQLEIRIQLIQNNQFCLYCLCPSISSSFYLNLLFVSMETVLYL